MKKDSYICLFANCIIVEGHLRAIICDIQRNNYYLIPKSLANLFSAKHYLHLEQMYDDIDTQFHHIINEYIEFLLENELAFQGDSIEELSTYPPLNLEWNYPAMVSNLLIDIKSPSSPNFLEFITQATKLHCRHVQLRFYRKIRCEEIKEISQIIATSNFSSVQFIIDYDNNLISNLIYIFQNNIKITSIILYNAQKDAVIFDTGGYGVGSIMGVTENILSEKNCGCIHHSYFVTNIETFTESLHHNSCLNRKISIDTEGNIKNCPSMPSSYGNIKDTTLEEALNHPDFKQYWNINKDKIHVCKDCEFRYVCTDCRAYVEDPADIYSKPLKCGYNPYTGEWSEWSTNPLKQKAIEYYGMQELVVQDAQPS